MQEAQCRTVENVTLIKFHIPLLEKSKGSGRFQDNSPVQVLRAPAPGEGSFYFRPGETREDGAQGDSKGWRGGELCDKPCRGKGHKPGVEGSNSADREQKTKQK